uniref:Uncharacterized protein n=1 Tax=Boechera stricta TaxID=72658 RepID=K4FZQ2_BOEST|nr:hypothetical protein 7G9.9 [Boechera stricta]
MPYYSMRLLGNKKPLSKSSSSAPRFSMRVSSKQAYICRDCGSVAIILSSSVSLTYKTYFIYLFLLILQYVVALTSFVGIVFGFNGFKVLFAVCAAPKRRFRPYTPDVSKNVNDKDVRKARKAELQRDEAIG